MGKGARVEARKVRKEIRKAMTELAEEQALVQLDQLEVGEHDIVILRFAQSEVMHPEVMKQSVRAVNKSLNYSRNVLAIVGDEIQLESWPEEQVRALRELCDRALGPTIREQVEEAVRQEAEPEAEQV